jgi:hypothetical protein
VSLKYCSFFPSYPTGIRSFADYLTTGVFQHPHPSTTHPFSTTLDCSDLYEMECRECERIWESRQIQLFQQGWLFTNDQKGQVHLRILLHHWGKQRAYWGKRPSSYIVKNALRDWNPRIARCGLLRPTFVETWDCNVLGLTNGLMSQFSLFF